MRDPEAEPGIVFATEEQADAEATRRNKILGEVGSEYFFVAAFVADGQWRVE